MQSDGQDSVPGRTENGPFIVEWQVDEVNVSSIHKCQVHAEPLTERDRQLFGKAMVMISMETDEEIVIEAEMTILTDSRQFVITSGAGLKKDWYIFHDDKGQVKCRSWLNDGRANYIHTVQRRVSLRTPVGIHECQMDVEPLSDDDRQLFRFAFDWVRCNGVDCGIIEILTNTCKFRLIDDGDGSSQRVQTLVFYRDGNNAIANCIM